LDRCEDRAGELVDRFGGEVVIGYLSGWFGLAEAFDDGCAELPTDRVLAEDAGVDMQQFHGECPLGIKM
jgi:hypothetical protein